jgi:hypothetical protein
VWTFYFGLTLLLDQTEGDAENVTVLFFEQTLLRDEGFDGLVHGFVFVDYRSNLEIVDFSFQADISLVFGLPDIQNDLIIVF